MAGKDPVLAALRVETGMVNPHALFAFLCPASMMSWHILKIPRQH